jgi:uncharacterized protein YlxW (UPF0749 family)
MILRTRSLPTSPGPPKDKLEMQSVPVQAQPPINLRLHEIRIPSWRESPQLRESRVSTVRRLLQPTRISQSDLKTVVQQFNALVFAHDIRKLEKGLNLMHQRLIAIETEAAKKDETNRDTHKTLEQAINDIKEELVTVGVLAAKSCPDLSETIGFPAYEMEIRRQFSVIEEACRSFQEEVSQLSQSVKCLEAVFETFKPVIVENHADIGSNAQPIPNQGVSKLEMPTGDTNEIHSQRDSKSRHWSVLGTKY